MILWLWATFSIWTASSWLAFPRFLIAVALLFVLPGNLLIRWLRLPLAFLENITQAPCLA